MTTYDLIVVGGGLAGLSATFTSARQGHPPLVLERGVAGGGTAVLDTIDNYPGILQLDAWNLTQTMVQQVKDSGCTIEESIEIKQISQNQDGVHKLVTTDGVKLAARQIIIATGSEPKMLEIANEQRFRQKGVHVCAQCAGRRYQGKEVVIAGNGDGALNGALQLLDYGCLVSFVTGDEALKGDVTMQQKLTASDCHFHFQSHIKKLQGNTYLAALEVENIISQKQATLPAEAVFVYRSTIPNSNILAAKKDARGFLCVDGDLKTSVAGIYAAGDVIRPTSPEVIAVGDGAKAAMAAVQALQRML